jgi:hypothetical protein
MRNTNILIPIRYLLVRNEEFCLEKSSETFSTHGRNYLKDLHTYLSTPYLLTYLPTHLLIYLPIYLPTYLLNYLPTYLPTHPPTYLPTYPPAHLFTYILICLLT